MREWSIRTVSKTVEPVRVPGVRIPLFPFRSLFLFPLLVIGLIIHLWKDVRVV
jgi:hypothetical protein